MSADVAKPAVERLGRLPPDTADEYATHVATYRGFVRGVVIAAAHTLVVLGLLAYFTT